MWQMNFIKLDRIDVPTLLERWGRIEELVYKLRRLEAVRFLRVSDEMCTLIHPSGSKFRKTIRFHTWRKS